MIGEMVKGRKYIVAAVVLLSLSGCASEEVVLEGTVDRVGKPINSIVTVKLVDDKTPYTCNAYTYVACAILEEGDVITYKLGYIGDLRDVALK